MKGLLLRPSGVSCASLRWLLLLGLAASLGCSEPRSREVPPSTPPGPVEAAVEPAQAAPDPPASPSQAPTDPAMTDPLPNREIATLGAGCFWCIEAVLLQVDGIESVRSGYMGGELENPTYKDICTGRTGHAEVVEVTFDPQVLPYEHLLEWFWKLHDPTTLNRQGNDIGTQYRSAIFVHSGDQRTRAEASRKAKDASGEFSSPIVTEIVDAETFWVAEDYHQDYYRQNKQQGYCRAVIAPKLDKLGLED